MARVRAYQQALGCALWSGHGFYTIKWCSVIFYLHFKKASLRELDIGFPICGALTWRRKYVDAYPNFTDLQVLLVQSVEGTEAAAKLSWIEKRTPSLRELHT
jgi:hypothetical protein